MPDCCRSPVLEERGMSQRDLCDVYKRFGVSRLQEVILIAAGGSGVGNWRDGGKFKNECKGMYTYLHVIMNYHSIFVKQSYNACDISRLEKHMFFYLPQIKHLEEPRQECLEINGSNEKMEAIFKKDPLFWMMCTHVYSKEKYDDLSKYKNG